MSCNWKDKLSGFDEFINEKLNQWEVPGAAVAIIKDGEIILSGGYGQRDIDNNLPVNSETIFAIGSCSKAFTSMAVGILVDEGKLDWDTPIRKYIPWFKMYDSVATERVTVRDLLCHRTGLPSHEAMWYNANFSRKEIVERVQFLQPSTDFRSAYHYQNQMFTVAGYLVEVVSGLTWEEFVKEKIFKPLKMDSSNFSVDVSKKSNNYSKPYDKNSDKIVEIPFRNIDIIGPAGSINSHINDMTKWLLLHLNKGKFENNQIISENNINQIHSPHMPRPYPFSSKASQYNFYGLGWGIEFYRGYKAVAHSGGIDGFISIVGFLPDKNLGVIVFSNKNSTLLPYMLLYDIYDRILGYSDIDWNAFFLKQLAVVKQQGESLKATFYQAKKEGTQPSHSLDEYCGKFENPGYGIVSITKKDQKLILNYNQFDFDLEHYHYDIFSFCNSSFGMYLTASFLTDNKGNINSLKIPFEPDPRVDEISFKRVI